jgi:hypothetical protein
MHCLSPLISPTVVRIPRDAKRCLQYRIGMSVFANNTCNLRTYKPNIEPRSRNHFCRAKGQNNTLSERVSVALFIQHAMRVRRVTLSSAACITLPYFTTLSHNGTIIRKGGKLLNTKCVF